MKEQERYKDKSQDTQKMMGACLDTLHKIHGEVIPSSFWVTLDMLADSFEIYYAAFGSVLTDGTHTKFNTKNPATAVFSQQQLYINRLLNNLGLTPMAAHKMTKGADVMPSDLDEFMN